ncbi:MAG: hypothetical protein PHT75_01235 [Bacilli bacterium]|nr:hypothetical protein [Bacilli bacterium]MDD3304739.1 hypothetical protein [Bacilli bacterium]MDD4053582.1 hypothetical protein [Bacilli bacterium]MDD4411081.1 hypothetical protein [Bacilli bacterium]
MEEFVKRISDKNNRKGLIIILIVLVLIIFLVANYFDKGKINIFESEVKIVKAEAKSFEYETYDNGLIKLDIPKNWKVNTAGDYSHYTFLINDPDNKYQIFVNLKSEGYHKSYDSKKVFETYYGTSSQAKMPVLSPQTTEAFYNIFNYIGEFNNTSSFTFPQLNNFSVVENFGPTIYGGDLLRATYTDANGGGFEGLFTATVADPGSYYVNSNMFDLYSKKVDTYPLSVYCTMFISAPINELSDYQEALNNMLSSLEYSSTFTSGLANEQNNLLSTIKANSKVYNETSDSIMASWENRNKSGDIISQKQSDATLGYERVYDTETNEIYKAYNGFVDDYKGDRYKPVTEDMYTEGIDGYIEK